MKKLRLIYLFLLLGLNITVLKAQTAFATEEDLKKQASKLFEEEKFEEAYPLYSQLTSIYPKDPNYNYRIGVCMLYAMEDKEQPIPYLEFASSKPNVDKEVFFYLAKAYHLNYRFDDAIKTYLSYKKVATKAKAEKLLVDRQIEMCKNGKKLLRNLTDLVVIDKKEMSRADFYRAYDISDLGGKLLVKPDEDQFKSSLDKKNKETSIIYLASNNNQIYFSSYGENPDRGKDIFIIRKLPTGEWSKPQTLGHPINTEYDEDFPFLHPNGKVLYFCSKGHNSMGGYDIFKSILNEETDTWNKPVNIDFPINTPDDDILFVTNEDEKEAFFSSARASATGKTAVYHIKSDRRAIDKAMIKGDLVKNREGQSLDIKITVKDMKDNSILGIFNSKTDGGYFISLPNGGRFLFTVESPDFSTQSEMVSLPVQSSFSPLKQEISYENGTDKLIIKNLFDQTVSDDDAGYLEVLSLIKEKSKMDVNVNDVVVVDNPLLTENEQANITSTKVTTPTTDTNTPVTLTNDDIIKIAYDDAKDAENEAKEAREQADISLNIANQKNELAQTKAEESKKLMADALTITDPSEKQKITEQANATAKEAELLNDETVRAFNLSKKLEKGAAAKQQEADLSLKYAKDLEAAVKAKSSASALTQLDEQKQKLETLSQEKSSADDIVNSLKIDSDNKQRELDKAVQTSIDIKQEIADNLTLIENVQADADKTKNDQLKNGLLDQIVELKQENIDRQKELEQNELKVVRLQKEFDGIKNETELVNAVIDRSKTETKETAAASIATIDKDKLEQKVSVIKTESPTNTTTDPIINSGTPESIQTDALVFDKLEQEYTNNLANAEKIEDPADREEVKAEVLKTWSEAINTEVAKQKENYTTATDPEIKKQLANNISKAEQLSKEKQKQADESLAKAEKLKEQEKILASNTNSNPNIIEDKQSDSNLTAPDTATALIVPVAPSTTIVADQNQIQVDTLVIPKLNEKYSESLADVEKIENEAERESAKAKVLKTWSEAIDTEVVKQKQDFVTATDPQTKILLANSISDAQKLSEEKQKQANESLAKAEVYKQEKMPVSDPSTITALTDTISKNTDPETETLASEQQFVYSSPSAKDNAIQYNVFTKQANDLDSQSNELKQKAESLSDINDRNTTYAQAEELSKQAENKKIEAAKVIATANKTEFTANQALLDQQAQLTSTSTEDEISMAELMKDEAQFYFDKAQKARTEADAADSYYSKETALQDAYTNEMLALEKQKKAGDIYKKYVGNDLAVNNLITNNRPVNNNVNPANNLLKTNDLPEAINDQNKNEKNLNDTLYLYSNPPLVRDSTTDNFKGTNAPITTNELTVVTTEDDIVAKNNTLPLTIVLSNNEKFERKTTPVYSAAKPIPVNEKLPEGLIFKVQIGAFRNPIPQDLFKGITPITGETTPQGFTRYTAGIFVKFATADNVKNEIRGLGYKDAFVVAFLNGKRIPINEALAMVGIDPSSISQTTLPSGTTNTPLIAANTLQNNINVQTDGSQIVSAENVTAVSGLFYTIQIGVYSQPVAASKLYNVKPLYSETTDNGMIRYTTGIYNNLPRAVEAKNSVVAVGIADAFVTAFYNGKRISMTEAAIVAKQGDGVFSTVPNMNAMPILGSAVIDPVAVTNNPIVNQQPTAENRSPINTGTTASNQLKNTLDQNNAMPIDPGVVYKVQIGAFKEEVPIGVANKFLQIANKGIKNYKDENGLTVYTVGNFKTYDDANKIKAEVIASGVTDAFIVAYNDGKKITVDEANQLLNK